MGGAELLGRVSAEALMLAFPLRLALFTLRGCPQIFCSCFLSCVEATVAGCMLCSIYSCAQVIWVVHSSRRSSCCVDSSLRYSSNYAKPVYGVATICHQVRWLRWGHPSLFYAAMSLLIWYKIFYVRDISYRLIWIEFINMFSVYAQSGMCSPFNWWIIVVLTYNPSVLMCVEITDAPKLYRKCAEMWAFVMVSGQWQLG